MSEKHSKEVYSKLVDFEVKIYEAQQTMAVGTCSRIEVKEHLKTCLQYSGLQAPIPADFEFIVDFVIKNFGIFRLKELGVAFELYALNKLNVPVSIAFTPKFVGDVMAAYKPLAVQTRQKTEPVYEETIAPVLDDEDVIRSMVNYWQTSKRQDWMLLNPMAFDILWKRKVINSENLNKERADKIKLKVVTNQTINAKNKDEILKLTDDIYVKNLCKKYTLYLYLNNELTPATINKL